MLKQLLLDNDGELEANFHMALTKVRGSGPYWQQQMGNLFLMDEQFGPSTFFVTLSVAEYRQESFDTALVRFCNELCIRQ